MKLLILATSVFSKITRERGVGEVRTDSDAKCYLRGESDEEQCCDFEDNKCYGCNPVLLADGIPCVEQEISCFCDESCILLGDCCSDHNDTCSFLHDDPWLPSTTTEDFITEDYTATGDYTTTVPPSCTGFVQMPVHSLMIWQRAKRVCRLLGGELAYFENEAELDSFNELDLEVTSWLGILRNKNGKHFIDVANREKIKVERSGVGAVRSAQIPLHRSTDFEPWIKVANWNNGEPNNAGGDERCVEAYTNGKWNDIDCREVNQVICRFEDPIYCL